MKSGIRERAGLRPKYVARGQDLGEISGVRSRAFRAVSVGGLALGAVALGAFAVGAVAIGRLAVGRARFKRLEIDELVVRRLRVIEAVEVPEKSDHSDIQYWE